MSTVPTQPVQLGYINSAPAYSVQSEVSALAHKHITLTWGVLGVLVIALMIAVLGGFAGYKSYEKALQRAEAAEQRFEQKDQQYQQMIADFQKQLTADAAERQAATDKQNQLQAQIDQRARQPLPAVVSAGLQTNATAEQAAAALQSAIPELGVVEASPDGKVSSTVTQTQAIITVAVAGQRAEADLKDTQTLYGLEQSKSTSLSKDLTSCQSTLSGANASLDDAKKTISAYKKAAKRSVFRKILDGAEKMALFAGGVYLGHRL